MQRNRTGKQRRAAPGRAGGARSSYRDAIEQSNASLDLSPAKSAARSDQAQGTNQTPSQPDRSRKPATPANISIYQVVDRAVKRPNNISHSRHETVSVARRPPHLPRAAR